ncbi:MAG TPA: response regulator transcription factor [Dehalococcoidia bacterium]|nr:response regulator transcription factor [Dehalococcoidia bacterium]
MTALSSPAWSVLITDDDDLLRLGLSTLLTEPADFRAVAEPLGRATAAARRLQPDLIVVDPRRRDSLDLALVRELARISPRSRLCIHTTVFTPAIFLESLLAGADAYLIKGNLEGAGLRQTLALLTRTGIAAVDQTILDYFRAQPLGTLAVRVRDACARPVTERERAVLSLLAEGLTEKDIAARLGIRRTTVGSHAHNLLIKLGAENAVQLGIRAVEQGLLAPAALAMPA